ncbi:MAG: LacI family DNA-binding transcriptional regulator [Pseudomonadota bacterium]
MAKRQEAAKTKGGRVKSQGPTGAEVAALAKVSRATVSRVFTAGSSVDPVTRDRVLEAARSLGYRLQQTRRARLSAAGDGSSRTIGIVIAGFDNPFYHTTLTEFLEHYQRRGLPVICHAAADLESAEEGVRAMLRHQVDAMIIAATAVTSQAVEECLAAGVPAVMFNRTLASPRLPSVQTDNVGCGQTMADFLALGGHRRIAYINGLELASTNQGRLKGFSERLCDLGLGPPIQEYGEYTYDGGREAVKRLMTCASPPDAIFCANDIMAFGALDGLRADLGLRVPEDVSITGCDDVPMAAWPAFSLTTIRQRRRKMVDATIELLDAALADGPVEPPPNLLVEGRLILRGSARLPKPGAQPP